MTYAAPTAAPAGTRVYTIRGGFGADGTRVYATVTGYTPSGDSIGVRYDNGGTAVSPVAHKAYIVVEDETPAEPVEAAEPETFTCECGDAEYPLTPGDDESTWCECGARLDEQRERIADRAPCEVCGAPSTDETQDVSADGPWFAVCSDACADKALAHVDGCDCTPCEEERATEPAAPARTCRDCGAPLESNGTTWVDARSGDDGGTYDLCPERWDEATATDHGHRAA